MLFSSVTTDNALFDETIPQLDFLFIFFVHTKHTYSRKNKGKKEETLKIFHSHVLSHCIRLKIVNLYAFNIQSLHSWIYLGHPVFYRITYFNSLKNNFGKLLPVVKK